jgi:hypothetical protein
MKVIDISHETGVHASEENCNNLQLELLIIYFAKGFSLSPPPSPSRE